MILRTTINPILELLLGIIIGVITVRLYRPIIIATQKQHVKANAIAIGYHTTMILVGITELIIAYVSVCYILEIDILHQISAAESKSSNGEDRGMIVSTFEKGLQFIHLLIYTTGIKIGQALQPVGLTGGIATGKSTVSRLLQQQSTSDADAKKDTDEVEFIIIDVDGIAHDILLPTYNDSVYNRLVNEFGTDILMKDETTTTTSHRRPLIDRRKLGDVVFKDRNKRRKLNSITHPKIIKIMIKSILYEGLNLNRFVLLTNNKTKRKAGRRVVCVDIPLLFEGGLPMKLLFGSTIIVVSCNPTLQLQRLQSRNTDLTLDQCKERIASQIPIEKKAKLAHYVIVNNGSLKSLKKEVDEVKLQVGNVIFGSQSGIIELHWLIIVAYHLYLYFYYVEYRFATL